MKTTIFAALLCAFSLTALADDYTLYVETAAGSSAYAYDDLQRITFKDGQMVDKHVGTITRDALAAKIDALL